MAWYATYDTNSMEVTGWLVNHPEGLAAAGVLEITQAQFDNRMAGPWVVVGGALVTPVPPPPSNEELAAAALATKLAAGIVIASTSLPAVDGTYALDPVSTAQIFQIGLFASQFGVFPSGGATQMYPDITSAPHAFTVAVFVAFLRAVAPLVSALETQAGVMTQGGTPTWPPQTARIA